MIYVLMSTYNGELYVKEQLDSLLAQRGVMLKIWIRDDGSTDSTVNVLKTYAQQYPNISVEFGNNVGVVASFFALLKRVPTSCEYVAFCDQDDYWEVGKLKRAIDKLSGRIKPALYCSRLTLVDRHLRPTGLSSQLRRPAGFRNALVQNIATGCTVVLNREAALVLRKADVDPGRVVMHDWWAYLVISAFGEIIFDEQAHIYYRQHGGNVVGAAANNWRSRFRRFLSKGARVGLAMQVAEFLRIYGPSLSEANQVMAGGFLRGTTQGFWGRVGYALRARVYRQRPIDDLVLRLLIVIKGI